MPYTTTMHACIKELAYYFYDPLSVEIYNYLVEKVTFYYQIHHENVLSDQKR
jgi:hypothetical protein